MSQFNVLQNVNFLLFFIISQLTVLQTVKKSEYHSSFFCKVSKHHKSIIQCFIKCKISDMTFSQNINLSQLNILQNLKISEYNSSLFCKISKYHDSLFCKTQKYQSIIAHCFGKYQNITTHCFAKYENIRVSELIVLQILKI